METSSIEIKAIERILKFIGAKESEIDYLVGLYVIGVVPRE